MRIRVRITSELLSLENIDPEKFKQQLANQYAWKAMAATGTNIFEGQNLKRV
jgi:hypothetical protein